MLSKELLRASTVTYVSIVESDLAVGDGGGDCFGGVGGTTVGSGATSLFVEEDGVSVAA